MTGAFSMIAGGASGIIVMARELGADERMVAVLQYLRVLLIVVLMPVVATVVYGASAGGGDAAAGRGYGRAGRPGCCSPSAARRRVWCVGRLVRLPVAALLGPMVAAAAVRPHRPGPGRGGAGPRRDRRLPGHRTAGRAQLHPRRACAPSAGRCPLALAVIVGLIVACAGLGAVLSAATGASALDGYLATTPGGLYAVLATASDSGADVTFVLAGPGAAAVRHAADAPRWWPAGCAAPPVDALCLVQHEVSGTTARRCRRRLTCARTRLRLLAGLAHPIERGGRS